MELENQVTQEVTQEQPVEEVKADQETQPEDQKEEVQEEVKQLTQKQIDEIIEKRLSRQKESFQKEKEELLALKEAEVSEKLKSYETDTKTLAEQVKLKDSELTRLRYGIKEDKFDEVLALREFKMKKDPALTEEDALKTVLEERPDYMEKTIKNIGIEIKQDTNEVPLYSDHLLNMFPFLKKVG
jgi:hypothetical protein